MKRQLIDELSQLRWQNRKLETAQIEYSRKIQELRRTNTFLENILESSSSISIISTDLEGNITFWNKGAENIFGYTSQEIVGHHKIGILYPDKKTKQLIKKISSSIVNEKKGIDFEIQEVTKDGRILWIHLTLTPRFKDNGRIIGILGIGEDITKRVQTEEALRKSQEQLYQSQKMEALGALVAGTAHEINNPINLITLNLSLLTKILKDVIPILKERAESEPHRKYGGLTYDFIKESLPQLLSDMDMATERVAKIVGDLKNFAKRTNISDKEPLNINIAIENALRLAKTTFKGRNASLELDLAPDLPSIEGNLQNIEQIVLNIIINAVQAINHSHGKIKITTRSIKSEGRVYVSISDNGRGISPAIVDKIFDPFVTDKQSEGGTGLGLSVTYSLVEAHKGEITFETEEGKGTVFTVFFPIFSEKKPVKILLVDDDSDILDMLTDALTSNGHYIVAQASNGIEGTIKLGTYRPALLVLDIFMPKMDGLGVCQAIKNEPELSDTKVIITTGFPDHPKLKKIAELGFTNILPKPLDLQDFLTSVDNMILLK